MKSGNWKIYPIQTCIWFPLARWARLGKGGKQQRTTKGLVSLRMKPFQEFRNEAGYSAHLRRISSSLLSHVVLINHIALFGTWVPRRYSVVFENKMLVFNSLGCWWTHTAVLLLLQVVTTWKCEHRSLPKLILLCLFLLSMLLSWASAGEEGSAPGKWPWTAPSHFLRLNAPVPLPSPRQLQGKPTEITLTVS